MHEHCIEMTNLEAKLKNLGMRVDIIFYPKIYYIFVIDHDVIVGIM